MTLMFFEQPSNIVRAEMQQVEDRPMSNWGPLVQSAWTPAQLTAPDLRSRSHVSHCRVLASFVSSAHPQGQRIHKTSRSACCSLSTSQPPSQAFEFRSGEASPRVRKALRRKSQYQVRSHLPDIHPPA